MFGVVGFMSLSRMCLASVGFQIPWRCLQDHNSLPSKGKSFWGQRKTFAQACNTACNISLTQLPTPSTK